MPDQRGDAINEVCRLVNSDQARAALSAAKDTGSFLSAVLSETVYRRTVAAGRTAELGRQHFLETVAHVSGKPDFEEPCRVHVPGLTAPAVRPYLAPEPSQDQQPASSATAAPAAGGGASFQFHAPVHDPTIAGDIKHLRIDRRQR
ncbi:hypothetical protein [Streptomyces sp. CA-132043]|uniref:hypothetical protein n=1 Tax=Streptomyces sp. CA-132043 TaxID=3240048 RepID=UPI003D8BD53D